MARREEMVVVKEREVMSLLYIIIVDKNDELIM